MKIRDGDWELQSWDAATGRQVWRREEAGVEYFRTDYPADDTIAQNMRTRNAMSGEKWGDGKLVASIPLNVYYDQLHEAQGQGDDKFIAKWLNDSDNAKWRTFDGKV